MSFMNGSSRVDNFWGYSLFLDDWLDVLVNVMVPLFTGDGRRFRGGMGGVMDSRCVFILGCITFKNPFQLFVVAVLIGSILSG